MPDQLSGHGTEQTIEDTSNLELIEAIGSEAAVEKMFRIRKTEDGGYVCIDCEKPVQSSPVILSEHASEFSSDHAGTGGTRRFSIPYCRQDLGEPPIEGCVHFPMFGNEGERAIYLNLV